MFKVINASGSEIAMVNQEQLDELFKQGLIQWNDTIIDTKTGLKIQK